MEEGRTKDIIEKLLDTIENGQSMPLSPGKVVVNRDETVTLLRELSSIMEGELKVYRDITDRKGKILTEAKQEAEEIVAEAEKSASRIRVTKRMTRTGRAVNDEELDVNDAEALRTANDIYAASVIYTDEMLTEVNDVVSRAIELMNNQYSEVMTTLAEKASLIEKNKAELMAGLKELEEEERYTNILELSQILSNELYRERMKALNAERRTERVHIPAGHIDDFGRTRPAKPEVHTVGTKETATETAPATETKRPAAQAQPAAETKRPAAQAQPVAETKRPAAMPGKGNFSEALMSRGRAEAAARKAKEGQLLDQ